MFEAICSITISVLIGSFGCYHFHMLCLSEQSVHQSLHPLQNCSALCRRTAMTSIQLNTKYAAVQQRICQTKVPEANDLMQQPLIGLEWNETLLKMSLTSGAGVSMCVFEPGEDILNILLWCKIVKTCKLILNLLLSKTLLSDYR